TDGCLLRHPTARPPASRKNRKKFVSIDFSQDRDDVSRAGAIEAPPPDNNPGSTVESTGQIGKTADAWTP
ncbi:hypothetical protein, partial [Actinorugispora endophytica]|uniref:hypothetical protein n=1 Tax=Actinorugispora endophytica TaxID=1605990 RepID=UPI001AAD185D